MPESEATLVQQAQKGDHEAFAKLVDEHQRYVYNLALRVVKDENEALDLTQETFVRAWTALPNFKGQSQFRTWLYRIVTNLCYNRLPNLRRSLNDLGDDVMEDIPESNFDTANDFESSETRRYLHKAIDDLDENYRLLITMRYQNELSYEEIASTLNLPLGTVKTGIFRAKAQLRNALAHLEDSWTERIQKNTRPQLLTWNDFALSIVIALCIGAIWFSLQNLPPLAVTQLRIQGILLYQDILVNARWLVPTLLFGIAALLSALTIPYLQRELSK